VVRSEVRPWANRSDAWSLRRNGIQRRRSAGFLVSASRWRLGRPFTGRHRRERAEPATRMASAEQLPPERWHEGVDYHRSGSQRDDLSSARRILTSHKTFTAPTGARIAVIATVASGITSGCRLRFMSAPELTHPSIADIREDDLVQVLLAKGIWRAGGSRSGRCNLMGWHVSQQSRLIGMKPLLHTAIPSIFKTSPTGITSSGSGSTWFSKRVTERKLCNSKGTFANTPLRIVNLGTRSFSGRCLADGG
jgi:hypothetical protein